MDKTTLLAELKKQRLVAVIRGKDEEEHRREENMLKRDTV